MQIKTLAVPFPSEWGKGEATNVYRLGDGKILVDAGLDSLSNRDFIKKALKGNSLKGNASWEIEKILITHGHLDHFGLSAFIQEQTSAEIFIHEADAAVMQDYRRAMDWFDEVYYLALEGGFTHDDLRAIKIELLTAVELMKRPRDFKTFRELELDVGGSKLSILHLPGHTPGSVGYVVGDVVFSGDVAIEGSTVLGDLRSEIDSIQKLKVFREVYTGHRRAPIGISDLEALEAHIATRLDEVLAATRGGRNLKGIVYTIYPWASGSDMNFVRKLTPIRQVLSYLRYLEDEGALAKKGNLWTSFKG